MGRVFYVIILSIDRQTCSGACLKNKGDTHGFQLDALSMDLSALSTGSTRKKKILVATLIINLGLLGYFKYFGTLTEAITGLFSADGTGTTLFQVALPIGISFYTF